MKLLVLLALAGLAAAEAAPFQPASKQSEPVHLSFGVYQTDRATVMYKQFTPFLEALQDDMSARLETPCDIELRIFKTYDDAIEALVQGSVDFVHFGPASYVTAKARNPAIELLAMEHDNGQKTCKGVIVVQKNSPIRTFEDLRGKRFAFGDRNSTIGRYLVQAELVAHGIYARDLPGSKYLDRHDQVASAVEHGDFDAGSVKASTFAKVNEKGTLRVLATFDTMTKPVVARALLDRAVFHALQQSLFACKVDSYFKAEMISGFMSASDEDYKLVRDGMAKAVEFERNAASR
jgi:phosphonate transport system substrate-binding protein